MISDQFEEFNQEHSFGTSKPVKLFSKTFLLLVQRNSLPNNTMVSNISDLLLMGVPTHSYLAIKVKSKNTKKKPRPAALMTLKRSWTTTV